VRARASTSRRSSEKRLDTLMATALFAPGRLTLDLLGARRIPPPLAHSRVGDGPILLVVENSDTYATLHALLADEPGAVGHIAFGSGHSFTATIAAATALPHVHDIAYFGDLDPDGLAIPQRAAAVATEHQLPAPRPARGLYQLLLASPPQDNDRPLAAFAAQQLVSWLPADLQTPAATLLTHGKRIAQEAVGHRILTIEPHWRTDLR
jgi:hypothetical protein